MKRLDSGLPWRFLAQGVRDGHVELRSGDVCDVPFDEIVVGDWLHVERLDSRDWFIGIGDAVLHVTVGRDGTPAVMLCEGEFVSDGDVTTITRAEWRARQRQR